MVLPSGLVIPPLPYLVTLVGATLLIGALLVAIEPPVDQRTVLALVPWIGLGGLLHALSLPTITLYSPRVAPLFRAPAVYLTTFIATGLVWITLSMIGVRRGSDDTISRNLGLVGTGILTVMLVLTLITALRSGLLAVIWPTVAFIGSLVVAAVVVLIIALWRTPVMIRARYAGPAVIFAHVFDGLSTAIGKDVLGVGERSPIPRMIMEFASTLPTASTLGTGWLFLLVKIVVASAVVVLMHEYLEEEPVEGSLIMAVIVAVGLGPAMNNFVLFLFTG